MARGVAEKTEVFHVLSKNYPVPFVDLRALRVFIWKALAFSL